MWLDDYAERFGDKIRTGKRSTSRIAAMTGLSPTKAGELVAFQ